MSGRTCDVLIIGGGAGGYTAALYCARSGYKTVILEKMSAGGQIAETDRVENYPGFDEGIDGIELGERMRKGAENAGAKTVYGEALKAYLTETPKRVVTDSEELAARAVVIATGARARELGLPEEKFLLGRGVAYCAVCDGARYKGGRVAVTGGGNSAVSDALYLSGICEKVYLIHRRETLRASKIYEEKLKESDVETVWSSRVEKILYDEKVTGIRVSDVNTGKSRVIDCDALFVAIGRAPETGVFAGQLETDGNGYIVADETTKTNIPGVFAVGDVRTKAVRQIVTATADGAVAAHYIEEYFR